MSAHQKNVRSKSCKQCGKPVQGSRFEVLCLKCRRKLPKCGSCHIVMAPEWGYLEGFTRRVGRFNICGGCDYEIKHKGFLHISETQYLLPSGRVKIKSMLAEDMVD